MSSIVPQLSLLDGKSCSSCGAWKSFSEFYFRKERPVAACKICHCAKTKAYAEANKEKMKIWYQEHYLRTKTCPDRQHSSLEEKREKHNLRCRRYYQRHLGKARLRHRVYRESHRKARSEITRRRYHRLHSLGQGYSGAEWLELCKKYGNKCLCCKATEDLTADHVVPVVHGGSNLISNIQILCRSCNSKKHTQHTDYRPS